MKRMDITGQKFHRITALEYVGNDKHKKSLWRGKCDCGTEVVVEGSALVSGNTKSCGCYNLEVCSERAKTHGMTGTRVYMTWANMKRRCYEETNEQYKDYGGRGIKVCDEWHKFESFYAWAKSSGYNDTLTIDRIDNNGNYCPENCKWSTYKENCRNKGNNRLLTYNGQSLPLSQWAEITGLKRETLRDRLDDSGWSVEDALTIPLGSYRKNDKYIIFEGKSKTAMGWSKETGLSSKLIRDRLKYGWTIEEALTTPKGQKRN